MADRLPLAGIRIADFTQVVIGPYCTMILAEMGAEVIKVETESRSTGLAREVGGFTGLNASKKGITLNLKHPKGAEVAKRLVAVSDIAAENFGTGVMERFGLGYEDLKKVKPDIIMLSNSSLGRTGPLRNAIGYYAEANAFAGFSYLTGYREGRPGQVGGIWTDHFTGMLAVFATLAALRFRNRTGKGQYVELTMADNVIASIPEIILDYSVNGRDRGRTENEELHLAPHNVYRCAGFDKWVAIAVRNDEEWASFCKALSNPSWCHEERFADSLSRFKNKKELDALVTEWTSQREDYEVMYTLQRAGVPAAPVLNSEGLVEDPQLRERDFLVKLGEVEGKPLAIPTLPWKLGDCPPAYYRIAPQLGEHNQHVLRDILSYSEGEIREMEQEQVLS